MILGECVFGLGAFLGWLSEFERWPILLQLAKIGIGIFHVEKGALGNLTAKNFGFFVFEVYW